MRKTDLVGDGGFVRSLVRAEGQLAYIADLRFGEGCGFC